MICQRGVTPTSAEAVGAALAHIHLAGHAPSAPLDGGRFGPRELAVRCGRVAMSEDSAARALAESLRSAMLALAERRDRRERAPSGLVHGDLFRDNVLWRPAAAEGLAPASGGSAPPGATSPCRIAALLDFESAHDGLFAYDLAVTILSWSFGSKLDWDIAAAIVRGYRSVRELEDADRAALYDEAIFAALRFTITRITDNAIRVGKRWQRFVERRDAIEQLGPSGLLEALGL
jgi:homoserine kinase type II